MRKFILFLSFYAVFGFDIDDFDKGVYALNSGDLTTAYETFYKGCEQNDELSCDELGFMYINSQVSIELDGSLANKSANLIGAGYLLKSCELDYLNSCDDIIRLKKELKDEISDEIYKKASAKYKELLLEYTKPADINSSN